MSYRFNDVLVKKSTDKTVLVAERMPKCISYHATKKAQKCLIWLTVKNDIDINGDVNNLSNVAVGKLIDTIDKHKGENIVIKIVNCGTMNVDDGELVVQETPSKITDDTTDKVLAILYDKDDKEVSREQSKSEYADFFVRNNQMA